MTKKQKPQNPPPSKEELETRKLSATAGGGLLGFAFGGPIGGIVGAVVSTLAANFFLNGDDR